MKDMKAHEGQREVITKREVNLQMFRFYLANLTSFCDEKPTSSVDEGKSVDVISLDFSKVFSTNDLS